jgi:hypothetical protein
MLSRRYAAKLLIERPSWSLNFAKSSYVLWGRVMLIRSGERNGWLGLVEFLGKRDDVCMGVRRLLSWGDCAITALMRYSTTYSLLNSPRPFASVQKVRLSLKRLNTT